MCSATIRMGEATIRMRSPASRRTHNRHVVIVAQEDAQVLIVAARQTGAGVDCRLGQRLAEAAFAFEGGTAAIALDIHLEDCGVVDEAIDDGERGCLVGEDLSPLSKWLISGDQ